MHPLHLRCLSCSQSFVIRCPLTIRSWRRAKIVDHLCGVYHFAPLCLVHFLEIRGFAACTTARALHNAPQHFKSCTIEEHSLNCISVPNFASLPQNFPKEKVPMHVHSARYAPHHQMQCTIESCTLNSISVPNLVSLAQNFLEPEDPSRIKFFGPGACSLHPTTTATRKTHILG